MATFYYDLTQMTTPATIPAIQAIAPASHIVFGSDIPRAGHYTRDFLDLLPKVGVAAADVAAIVRTNAEALFPRIRARSA
jgi:predicted TIM-barrel fold metal-dependent hydrolase